MIRRTWDPLNTIRVPNHGTKQGTGLYIIIIINWYRERVGIGVFRVRCVTLSSGGRVFSSNITHKSVREESDTRALSLSLSITAINHNESLLPLGWGGMCFHEPRGVASSPSSPVARLFRARRLYNSISSPRHPSNSVSSFS